MADSGTTKRYLLYAIGEILLVMIGILLALQVNNWSERKKARAQELNILHELNANLAFDIQYNQWKVSNNKSSMASCRLLLSHLENDVPFHDSLAYHFANAHNANIAILRDYAYEKAKTYGLDFLTYDSTKYQLSWTYEVNIEFLDVLSDRQDLYHYNVVVPQLTKLFDRSLPQLNSADYFMHPINYESIRSNQEYKNILRSTIQMRSKYLYHYELLVNRMIRLSKYLQMEIDERI